MERKRFYSFDVGNASASPSEGKGGRRFNAGRASGGRRGRGLRGPNPSGREQRLTKKTLPFANQRGGKRWGRSGSSLQARCFWKKGKKGGHGELSFPPASSPADGGEGPPNDARRLKIMHEGRRIFPSTGAERATPNHVFFSPEGGDAAFSTLGFLRGRETPFVDEKKRSFFHKSARGVSKGRARKRRGARPRDAWWNRADRGADREEKRKKKVKVGTILTLITEAPWPCASFAFGPQTKGSLHPAPIPKPPQADPPKEKGEKGKKKKKSERERNPIGPIVSAFHGRKKKTPEPFPHPRYCPRRGKGGEKKGEESRPRSRTSRSAGEKKRKGRKFARRLDR